MKRKKYRKLTCGSGGNQWGAANHQWKGGISLFRRHMKDACERCGSRRALCGHHRDRNRRNPSPRNIETLCKRCHQLEHKCVANLPRAMSKERRRWQAQHMKRLNATLKRDRFGRLMKKEAA